MLLFPWPWSCHGHHPPPRCYGGGTVTAIPHTFTKRLHDLDVTQNHTATYWAIVRPPWAAVRWFKDGDEVHETRRFHILEDDEGGRYLEIEHALRSDMGTVTCRSKDDETEAQLNVAGNVATATHYARQASMWLKGIAASKLSVCHKT
jgi:hypothetical protein